MGTVVIVGGGVIGCAAAERLSRERRHRVLLLERDTLGSHASGAAAGLLGPYGDAGDSLLDPAGRSLALFPELVARVERSGIAVNVVSYCGLDNVWQGVMGSSHERPTPEQFARMKELLDGAMKDGARPHDRLPRRRRHR